MNFPALSTIFYFCSSKMGLLFVFFCFILNFFSIEDFLLNFPELNYSSLFSLFFGLVFTNFFSFTVLENMVVFLSGDLPR